MYTVKEKLVLLMLVVSCFTRVLQAALPILKIKALKSFLFPVGKKQEMCTSRTIGTKTFWATVISAMTYFRKD